MAKQISLTAVSYVGTGKDAVPFMSLSAEEQKAFSQSKNIQAMGCLYENCKITAAKNGGKGRL